ncbi:MAG: hypothetical protein ACSHUF_00025 [Candidatus Nasuia deltocephalinicola]
MSIYIYISGGIDSFISLMILKILKYDFKIFYILNWAYKKRQNILNILNNISKLININIIILNLKNFYRKKVFLKFLKNYNNKLLINIDFYCNKYIKFGVILNYLYHKKNNFKIVTGHFSKYINKKKSLYISKDFNRDQTYFIPNIYKKNFNFLFVLNNSFKISLKKVFNKFWKKIFLNYKSSKGICFLENKNLNYFLKYYIYNKLFLLKKISKYLKFLLLSKLLSYKISNVISIKIINFKFKKIKNFFFKCKLNHSKNFFICNVNIINNFLIIKFKKKKIFFKGQNITLFYKNKLLYRNKI